MKAKRLIHSIALLFLRSGRKRATALNIPMTFATAVVIIIVTAFLIALALKVPYIKMLTNPSSLLIQNTKS
jgi:hypothetical protein